MSQTILFKDGLRIGKAELELLQNIGQAGLAELATTLSGSLPAVLPATSGSLATELAVTVSGTNVAVAPGTALLANGTLATLEAATTVSVSDPTTNGKVVLTSTATPYAPGSIAIGASDRLTLTYTAAAGSTKTLTDFYQANGYIRLYNAGTSTSLGTFRIDSVTSGQIVLAESVPGSTALSGLKHAPAGKFFPGYPAAGVTTDLESFTTPTFSIQSSSYTAASNEVVLATVTRSGSSVTVTDARTVFRPRGLSSITNDMVAANASIAESKLALSPALVLAKALANYWRVAGDNQLVASTSDLYVTRSGALKRVLVEGDSTGSGTGSTPAFAGLSVSPASASVRPGATQALTASAATVQSGASITYTFTSSNTAIATVTSSGASATVTGVAEGSVTISVRATAPAVGSYTSATETYNVPITVSSSTTTPILTAISISPTTLALNVSSTGGTSVTASVTSPTSPSVTWLWELLDQTGNIVTLSATNTATITISPKIAGSGRVKVTATAAASGIYSASTLSAELPVSVTEGLALLGEPGYRVRFARPTSTGPVVAYMRWGIGGTYTASGLTATLSISSDDAAVTFSANQLAGQAFYDANDTMYLIASNTASTANPCTVTVTKLSNGGANPAGTGTFVIRSVARGYEIDVLSANGVTSYFQRTVTAGSTREVLVDPTGPVVGSTYKMRLKSTNNAATPGFFNNDVDKVWATSSTAAVTVPSSWITNTATTSSVTFSWAMLQQYGYDPTTMDYYCQWQINNGSWGNWYRANDDVISASTVSFTVSAPESSTVKFRVKITDLSGLNAVNNVAYDAEVTAATYSISQTGTASDKTYPFTMTSSSAWTEIIPGSGRYVLPLTQYDGTPTSFTTRVGVDRIDLSFSTGLAQASGTAVVKALVYPTNNPSYSLASNTITAGETSYKLTSFGKNGGQLPIGANEFITVALEYAASGNPNSLDPTGIGYIKVFYSPLVGEDQ